MDISVYKSVNEKKGIIAVNFINPLSGKKTTKSLGKEIGLDMQRADEIIADIKELINDSKYYADYSCYLAAKEKFGEQAIRIVFQNTDLLRSYDEENVGRSIENMIGIKASDGKRFRTYSIQFIGTPGAGKTKTIQQLLGSIQHNVPATTTSNTTVGSFEAYITESRVLECVGAFMSMEELQEQLLYNVYNAMEEALMHKNNDSELHSDIFKMLMSSRNLKFKLYLLMGIQLNEKYTELVGEVESIARKAWDLVKVEKNVNITDYRDAPKEVKQLVRLTFEESEIISSEVDELIKNLCIFIEAKTIEVFNDFINYTNEMNENVSISIEIVTNDRKIEKRPDEKLPLLVMDKDEWIKIFYFSIWIDDETPDFCLRDNFFRLLKFFSCANEDESNLLPLISRLRIKGNFRGLWQKDDKPVEDVIIIDSEGVGHDSDQIGFSSEVEDNMLYADKIMWIIDATKGFNKQEKAIIKTLAINGSLPKTICGFNRLEKMDVNSEKTLEAKRYRLKQLIENLFASFENDEFDEVDYSKLKHILIENQLCFEHLDRILDGSELRVKEIDDMLSLNIDESAKETLRKINPPIEITDTIKSLEKIIDKKEKDIKNGHLIKPPVYFYIKLSNLCDAISINFVREFSRDIDRAHWNTVRAFNCRMYHNFSDREWWFLMPETKLKSELKKMVLGFLMNPSNFNEDEINQHVEWFQMVQEEVSRELSDMVKREIYDDVKEKWGEALYLKVAHSGNERKYKVKKIIEEIYYFDWNSNIKNVLFVDLVSLIDKIDILREENIKFVVI